MTDSNLHCARARLHPNGVSSAWIARERLVVTFLLSRFFLENVLLTAFIFVAIHARSR